MCFMSGKAEKKLQNQFGARMTQKDTLMLHKTASAGEDGNASQRFSSLGSAILWNTGVPFVEPLCPKSEEGSQVVLAIVELNGE